MIGLALNFVLGNWQRFAVYALVASLAAGMLELDGYRRGVQKLYDYQIEQAKAAIPIVVKQGAITEKIVTRYRDRLVEVRGATEFVEKEIVRYVPPSADPVLGDGWVRLHDAAATGAVPEATPGTDVAAPAIAASQALKGVVGNYGSCHATEVQLMMLQLWVAQQYEVMNQTALRY